MKKHEFPVGSVHGRFQPPHNQHLEYILEAKKRCAFLWIGVTQFDIADLQSTPSTPHRSEAKNNPLSYYERIVLIREILLENQVEENEFSFLPFPLEKPSHLKGFLPLDIPIFTTICDDWNSLKIKLLKECGYRVIVLFERDKGIIRGKSIRTSIVEGRSDWERQVPESSIDAVYNLQIQSRLQQYSKKS